MSRAAVRFLLLSTLALAAACDKVPLLAPTQSTLTLVISTTTLPVNGTAQVIATVIEQAGTPVQNGTMVTFTGSLGTFDPVDAPTQNGKAVSTFRAGSQSGTGKISAFSGAAKAEEIEIKIGGAAAESVVVRAEPATVPVTGGTVQLIAVVTDVSGNALTGAPVVFTSDNGQLAANSVTSDANGEARTTLTTNRTSIVKARVGTKEGTITINAVNLPTVTIAAAPSPGTVGLPVTFTITPGNVTGGSPIQNVTLDFGDGTPPANLGAISGATSVAHVYTRANTYTVTATATDISGQRIQNSAVVSVLQPTIGVAFSTPPSTAQVGVQASFTVAVTNPSNIPLATLTVNFGDGSSSTLTTTGGTATHTYTVAGTYNVTARLTDQAGNVYTATTQLIVAPAPALPDITLDAVSADPAVTLSCVPASGYPKTCTANFVGIGVRVQFTAGSTFGVTGYVFNYGDGSRPESTTSRTVDHVFTARGEYVITVTVLTSTGSTGTQRLTLIIT